MYASKHHRGSLYISNTLILQASFRLSDKKKLYIKLIPTPTVKELETYNTAVTFRSHWRKLYDQEDQSTQFGAPLPRTQHFSIWDTCPGQFFHCSKRSNSHPKGSLSCSAELSLLYNHLGGSPSPFSDSQYMV